MGGNTGYVECVECEYVYAAADGEDPEPPHDGGECPNCDSTTFRFVER